MKNPGKPEDPAAAAGVPPGDPGQADVPPSKATPSPGSDDPLAQLDDTSSAADLDPGKTQRMQSQRLTSLGPFTIEEKIGEGGMGVVYRAYDPDLHRVVAIKRIHPRFAGDDEYAQRFLTEARAVAATVHPNLAQIFSIHSREANLPPYFVMEYVDGESTEQHVESQGPLTVARALEVVIQSARGLRAAAKKGIVHRDVKPSNILLTRRGEVKLVDFGLARRTEEVESITQVGVMLGTPHFLSPEQGRGRAVDHRSDMYSLGCTFYYLLTGKEPFQGQNKVEIIVAHANEPPPRLTGLNPPPPRAVEDILQRLLAKQPEDRYQDYDQLLVDLERARALLDTRSRSWQPPLRLAALILIGVVAITVTWAALQRPRVARQSWADSGRAYLSKVYSLHPDQEILEYDFHNGALQDYFIFPPSAEDEGTLSPQHPIVKDDSLQWQNFPGEVLFPYLTRFDFLEIHELQFRGEPDFEVIIGHDPLRPENRVRLSFGIGGRNRDIIECWQQGKRLLIPATPRTSDFSLSDRDRYTLRLSRRAAEDSDGAGGSPVGDELMLIIEQHNDTSTGSSERERIRFSLPAGSLPAGGISLRVAGLRSWRASVQTIMVGGLVDHERVGREKRGR